MASKHTVKARIPIDDVQANAFIKEIGDIEREIDRIKADRDDAVETIVEEANQLIKNLERDKEALNKGSDTYAFRNRNRLTKGTGRKTVVFDNGEYQWRWGNWSVVCTNEDAAIEWYEENDMGEQFVDVKKKLKKDAMKRASNRKLAEKCPSVKIERDEVFRVRFYAHDSE